MSIKRYAPSADGSMVEDEDGPFVTFDTMWAEAFGFCSVLSDIRTALGVGQKPMLGELAGEAARLKRERDAAVEALKDEIQVREAQRQRHDGTFHMTTVALIALWDDADFKARAVLAKIGGKG